MKTWNILVQKRILTWENRDSIFLLGIYDKRYHFLCDKKVQMNYFKKAKLHWDWSTNTNWNEISFRDGVNQFVTPWQMHVVLSTSLLWLIILKDSHKHMQPVINQPKQQPVNSLITSCYSLVSPPENIMIEVLSLETIYLIICTNYSETSQLQTSQIVDLRWIEDEMCSPNWGNLC